MILSEAVAEAMAGQMVTRIGAPGVLVMMGEVRLTPSQSLGAAGVECTLRIPPHLAWVSRDGTTIPAVFTEADYTAEWRRAVAESSIDLECDPSDSHPGIVRVHAHEVGEAVALLEGRLRASRVQAIPNRDGSVSIYCNSPFFERSYDGQPTKNYRILKDELSNQVLVKRAP